MKIRFNRRFSKARALRRRLRVSRLTCKLSVNSNNRWKDTEGRRIARNVVQLHVDWPRMNIYRRQRAYTLPASVIQSCFTLLLYYFIFRDRFVKNVWYVVHTPATFTSRNKNVSTHEFTRPRTSSWPEIK